MPTKRHLAQITVLATATALIASGVAGALEVPSGYNIAAALIITLCMLVEAPITAMALAKHKSKHH